MQIASISDILSYLEEALEGFDNDPADTDFQRGYQSALQEVYDVVNS